MLPVVCSTYSHRTMTQAITCGRLQTAACSQEALVTRLGIPILDPIRTRELRGCPKGSPSLQ